MAPLTWRNVNAPDFSAAGNILNSVARNWSGAGQGIGSALTSLGENQQQSRSAAALPLLAQIANESDVNPIISQIENMVAPHNRSRELLTAIANARNTALGYEQSRANTSGIQGQERRSEAMHPFDIAAKQADITHKGAVTNRIQGIEGRDQFDHDWKVAGLREEQNLIPDYLRRMEGDYSGHIPSNVSPEFQRHIPGIFAGESGGDYDKLYANAEQEGGPFAGTKLTEMSVDQALEFADPKGAYGQWVAPQNEGTVSTPMGAYQVVGSTLRAAKEGLGLKGDEIMTPELQDQIGEWIFENQGIGAWVGYRPEVTARGQVSDLAQGTHLGLERWEQLGSNLYNTQRTRAEHAREDEQRILTEQAKETLRDNMDLLTRDGVQDNDNIRKFARERNLSQKQEEALILEAEKLRARDPNRFVDVSVGTDPELTIVEDELAQFQEYQQSSGRGLPSPAEAHGLISDAFSGDRDSKDVNSRETVLGVLTELSNQQKLKMDIPASADIIERLMRDTGLPAEVVIRSAIDRVKGKGIRNNRIAFSEDAIKADLEKYKNFKNYRSSKENEWAEARHYRYIQSQLDRAKKLRQDIAHAKRHGETEKEKTAQAELGTIKQNILTAQDNRKAALEADAVAKKKQEEERAAEAAEAANQLASRQRMAREAKERGADIPTPAGNIVDPEASAAMQTYQGIMRAGEQRSYGEQVDHSLQQAVGTFLTDIANFFRPAGVAESINITREKARNAQKWFNSDEARNFLESDPRLLEELGTTPESVLEFYEKYSGNVDASGQLIDSVKSRKDNKK